MGIGGIYADEVPDGGTFEAGDSILISRGPYVMGVPIEELPAGDGTSVIVEDSLASDSTINAVSVHQVKLLNDALANKLDSSSYVQHYRGKYASLASLQAIIPSGDDGDYAIVDTGAGNDAVYYIWDAQDGWVSGGTTTASTTDTVTEGSTNFYFTESRVRNTVLTGLSLATNAVISASDSVLGALGKLQKQISDLSSSLSNYLTTSSASSTYLTQSNASSTYLSQSNASTTYATIANQRYTFVSGAGSTYIVPASAVTENGRTIIELSNNSLGNITINAATGTGKVAGDSVHISITGTYAAQVLVASGVTLQGDLTFSYKHQTKTLVYKGSNTWKVVG